jgi:chromosome segregation ATPase
MDRPERFLAEYIATGKLPLGAVTQGILEGIGEDMLRLLDSLAAAYKLVDQKEAEITKLRDRNYNRGREIRKLKKRVSQYEDAIGRFLVTSSTPLRLLWPEELETDRTDHKSLQRISQGCAELRAVYNVGPLGLGEK